MDFYYEIHGSLFLSPFGKITRKKRLEERCTSYCMDVDGFYQIVSKV
jgi:hypothetical protein